MEISARNQLSGTITQIDIGALLAEVTVDTGGGQTIVSIITKGSVEQMGLKQGDQAVAVVKSTDVLIAKE